MRADKVSSFRQRLRQGADNFEFGALIHGVSTLDDPEETEEPAAPFVAGLRHLVPETQAVQAASIEESPAGPLLTLIEMEAPALQLETPAPTSVAGNAAAELADRLALELALLSARLNSREIRQAGPHLAAANRILDLLRTVDPSGDQAREGGAPGAPPPGRAWPAPVWSLVEFAESPLSGLLPPDADELFARDLLYAAWGVSFE